VALAPLAKFDLPGMRKKSASRAKVETEMSEPTIGRPSVVHCWFKELRLHQWAKNALVFAPLALAGIQASWFDFAAAAFGFVALGLASSVGYIINDLCDRAADRLHPTKRFRPFACGALPVSAGLAAVPIGIVAAVAFAAVAVVNARQPQLFVMALCAYLIATFLYSVSLKRMPPFDLVALGGLFTIRVLAGMAFVPPPVSLWLLTFAMFMFVGLAAIKRFAELLRMVRETGGAPAKLDRGYDTDNLTFVMALGVSCGIAAILIFVMYLILDRFPAQIFRNPISLWLIVPIVLAWLMRMWLQASRGEMDEDPIAFALHDRQSWTLGAACAVFIFFAW
jgi:4-hydroxybenzoate polyprenyltransferase